MHILISSFNFPARSETFIVAHVVGLMKRGYQVTVLSYGPGHGIEPNEVEEIQALGVEMITIPGFDGSLRQKLSLDFKYLIGRLAGRWPWTVAEMIAARYRWNVIRRVKPDRVHVHFGAIAATLHGYGLPPGTIVTWHGHDANVEPLLRGEGIYCDLFSADCLHTVGSRFMNQRLLELGASADQISQVPMGIDVEAFGYRRREPSRPLRILSVGRLCGVKGHRFLIQAVSELLLEGERVHLRIIGAGPLAEELRCQIENSGQSQYIEVLGPKASGEVRSELGAADLFALTGVADHSGTEAQGIVYAEAQAVGLPVIGSSVGGVPESMIDGETGVLCEPGNVVAIKRAIRFFIERPSAIGDFGLRGRKFVKERFSVEVMLDRFEALYHSR